MDQPMSIAVSAIALGLVGLASVASLAFLFLVAGPLGTINDLGNALVGIMSGLLG